MPSQPPESPIVDFHQDGEGHWVADLECGHSQHVRHRPPLEVRPWVTSDEGRRERMGVMLACSLCRMPKLPPGLVEYNRTTEFNAESVPVALRKSHTLKAGTWGELVVLEGYVHYVLEADEDAVVVLGPGVCGVIAPLAPHHVDPREGARFFVRFLRASPSPAG